VAGHSKPIFVGALLLGAIAAVSLAQAEPGQAWSDPPPDLNAGPLTPDPGPSIVRPLAAQDWPDEAARRLRTPQTAVAQPSKTRDVEATAAIQTAKADATTTEAARASEARQLRVRQAAARKARAQQVALAKAEAEREERTKQAALAEAQAVRREREKQAEKARKVQEARVAARARVVASARERRRVAEQLSDALPARAPQPKVYEVMRLRTLVFPDGQIVQVLTRPDQEAIDLSLR
jgi:flagellar biosynthesis GTPase FlhF